MAKIDWRWWLAVGIAVASFLLMYPNPVSPAAAQRDSQRVSPYDYRPSFCARLDMRKDFRCASTVGRWM